MTSTKLDEPIVFSTAILLFIKLIKNRALYEGRITSLASYKAKGVPGRQSNPVFRK